MALVQKPDGAWMFLCTAHDIDSARMLDYDDVLPDDYCPVCEWELDVLGKCPFREHDDHKPSSRLAGTAR